jgi:hypothetical protein
MKMRDADNWRQSPTELQCFGDAGAAHAGGTIGHIFKGMLVYIANQTNDVLWYVVLCKAGY